MLCFGKVSLGAIQLGPQEPLPCTHSSGVETNYSVDALPEAEAKGLGICSEGTELPSSLILFPIVPAGSLVLRGQGGLGDWSEQCTWGLRELPAQPHMEGQKGMGLLGWRKDRQEVELKTAGSVS